MDLGLRSSQTNLMLILVQSVMTFPLSLFQKDYKRENRMHKSNPKEIPTFNRLNEMREQWKREKKLWELKVPNGVNYRRRTEKKRPLDLSILEGHW